MPTTNPVPSTDPSDLFFNAGKLDEAVNSSANTYTDRLGVQRRTLIGLEAEFPNAAANAAAAAASAVDAADSAQTAQDDAAVAAEQAGAADASRVAAEAARDAAQLSAGVYATTAAGLAATTNGEYFSVPASSANEYLILYLNNAGSAVEQKRYPAAATVEQQNLQIQAVGSSGKVVDKMVGAPIPVVTNWTDGLAATYTLSDVTDGKQIALATNSRAFSFDFGRTFGGARARIKHVATLVSGGGGIGVVFGKAPNRIVFSYTPNGWLQRRVEGVSLDNLYTNWPSYSAGATLSIDIDILADGTASITFDAGGGARTWTQSGVPFGTFAIMLGDGQTSVHRTTFETMPAIIQETFNNFDASADLDGADREALNFTEYMMSVLARPRPSGFPALPNIPLANGLSVAPKFYKLSGGRKFATNILLRQPLKTTTVTYYVDGVAGNDSNVGTAAAPFKSIKKAITASNFPAVASKTVYVKPGLYNRNTGWFVDYENSTSGVTQLLPWGAGDVINSAHYPDLIWALVSGTTYSTTIGANGLTDVWDVANLNADGDYLPLTAAASLAACQATPNSRYLTGTTLYVNLANGRAPDANVYAYAAVDGAAHKAPDTIFYMERIKFRGGNGAFAVPASSGSQYTTVLAKDCEFSYAHNDGFSNVGGGLYVLQNCFATSNMKDGISWQKFNSISPTAFELNCTSRWNGRNGAITNQASTAHASTIVVRMNGRYYKSAGGNVVDVNDVRSWNMGCDTYDSRAANLYDWGIGSGVPGDASKMWLDTCSSGGTSFLSVNTEPATAIAYTYDLVATATTAGTIVPYNAA